MTYHKKLIEVALPLEAINKASAWEKSMDLAMAWAGPCTVRTSL